MSQNKEEKDIEEPEQDEEIAEEIPWQDYLTKLQVLIYNQPDVVFSILQELFDLLVAAKVMAPEDVEALIRAGVDRWTRRSSE